MLRVFVYTKVFDQLWKSCGLSDSEQSKLEKELLLDTAAGDIIPGTRGLRKLRWKIPGKGKRGGIRILYVDFPAFSKLFMLFLIRKNEKENITASEKKLLNNLIDEIESGLKKT
jgi:hypothetical protein